MSVDDFAVQTFKRRSGRVRPTQSDALADLWPRFGVAVDGRPIDLPALFGRSAPVVLEIGFGMGEATAELAAAQPEVDVLAVDVHTPGQGNLLKMLAAGGQTNVRLASGDARTVLVHMLRPGTLAGVRIFFPDPWPKERHRKRRLVTAGLVDLVADRLADGGFLHVATDMPFYAAGVRELVARHPALEPASQAPWRPETKFERRGVAAGRPSHDLAAYRRPRTRA